jgi:hypothetical protein
MARPYFRAVFRLTAAFAFLGARPAFDGAAFFGAFFALPAAFTIGTSQQTIPQASQVQASSTETIIPHSSQTYRSPDFALAMSSTSLLV